MSFEETKAVLGTLIHHKKGFAFKSKDYLEKGIPVIRVSNFTGDSISQNDVKFVSAEFASTNKDVRLYEHDIVIATVGSWPNNPASVVGRTISVPSWANKALMNQNSVIIRARSKSNVDQKFIYYQLKSEKFSHHLISKAQGSANQASITLDAIFSYEINWPDIEVRQAIVEVLGALDNRITLLRETNTTLEAIAQTLFKSWFVDFDPVRAKQQGREPEGMDAETAALFPDSFEESELGLVPREWRVKTIDDVCDFQNGYAFKSTEMSKSKDDTYKIFKMGNIKKGGGLNRTGTKDYYEISKSKELGRYLLKKGDLLMCMTDMKNNVALLGHTALMDIDNSYLLNQRVGMIRSKDKKIANYPFLYLLTNSDLFIADLRNRANSGVQVNLSTQEIKNTKFILPTRQVHHSFNQVVEAIYEKLFILEQQQDCLSEIRDTLLPRLISGQLRLPDAEALIEEAV